MVLEPKKQNITRYQSTNAQLKQTQFAQQESVGKLEISLNYTEDALLGLLYTAGADLVTSLLAFGQEEQTLVWNHSKDIYSTCLVPGTGPTHSVFATRLLTPSCRGKVLGGPGIRV